MARLSTKKEVYCGEYFGEIIVLGAKLQLFLLIPHWMNITNTLPHTQRAAPPSKPSFIQPFRTALASQLLLHQMFHFRLVPFFSDPHSRILIHAETKLANRPCYCSRHASSSTHTFLRLLPGIQLIWSWCPGDVSATEVSIVALRTVRLTVINMSTRVRFWDIHRKFTRLSNSQYRFQILVDGWYTLHISLPQHQHCDFSVSQAAVLMRSALPLGCLVGKTTLFNAFDARLRETISV